MAVGSAGTEGENNGSSWWKMTWHRTGVDLATNKLFSPMLVMRLGAVWDLGLAIDGGGEEDLVAAFFQGEADCKESASL